MRWRLAIALASIVACSGRAPRPSRKPEHVATPASHSPDAHWTEPRRVPGPRAHRGKLERGKATWYGGQHQGGPTASGERFDKNALTAAHKHLRMNTIVRVTNLKNGRTVEVRINDRGPYGKGHIIDLSEAAARRLGMIADGIVPVTVEVVSPPPPRPKRRP